MTSVAPSKWTAAEPVGDGARVSFRQPVTDSGFVDAAWWPRSRDLVAELRSLLPLLDDARRPVFRVSVNPSAWDGVAPRVIQVEGRSVKLSGFVEQDPLLVMLADDWRDPRINVLLIAPDTDPEVARRALLLAADADCISRPADILRAAAAAE